MSKHSVNDYVLKRESGDKSRKLWTGGLSNDIHQLIKTYKDVPIPYLKNICLNHLLVDRQATKEMAGQTI